MQGGDDPDGALASLIFDIKELVTLAEQELFVLKRARMLGDLRVGSSSGGVREGLGTQKGTTTTRIVGTSSGAAASKRSAASRVAGVSSLRGSGRHSNTPGQKRRRLGTASLTSASRLSSSSMKPRACVVKRGAGAAAGSDAWCDINFEKLLARAQHKLAPGDPVRAE
jgi:hypothetical protein